MLAFIIAGIVEFITLAICFVMGMAAGMSDAPSASAETFSQVKWVFIFGTVIAALIAASHWLHIGW